MRAIVRDSILAVKAPFHHQKLYCGTIWAHLLLEISC